MSKDKYKDQSIPPNNKASTILEAAAEQWVNLVLTQISYNKPKEKLYIPERKQYEYEKWVV